MPLSEFQTALSSIKEVYLTTTQDTINEGIFNIVFLSQNHNEIEVIGKNLKLKIADGKNYLKIFPYEPESNIFEIEIYNDLINATLPIYNITINKITFNEIQKYLIKNETVKLAFKALKSKETFHFEIDFVFSFQNTSDDDKTVD